jgi:hypothetical protein
VRALIRELCVCVCVCVCACVCVCVCVCACVLHWFTHAHRARRAHRRGCCSGFRSRCGLCCCSLGSISLLLEVVVIQDVVRSQLCIVCVCVSVSVSVCVCVCVCVHSHVHKDKLVFCTCERVCIRTRSWPRMHKHTLARWATPTKPLHPPSPPTQKVVTV